MEEIRARCDQLTRCGLFADHAVCFGFFRNLPDPNFDASIAAGKIKYDGARAKHCYDALSTLTCDATVQESRVLPAACGDVFTGAGANGEACVYDVGCRSGRCNKPSCETSECCPGVCEPNTKSGPGATCGAARDCEDGAFCGTDKLCHSLLPAGSDCERDLECGYGLACVGGGITGTCREVGHAGDGCPFLRCADIGLRCVAGTCVSLGLPGDACTASTDCSPYAECDEARGLCIDVPTIGMPCNISCAGDAWCQSGTNICVAPLADGELCGAVNQCASLNCPEDIILRCAPAPVCF